MPEKTIPGKDDETSPDMRIDDSPHKTLELEEDVGNVEYRQQPAVTVACEIEAFFHASDFGIANIRAIEEREKVCRDTS